MPVSRGQILQLQHYSVNDGDGIRTVVFFAGCPLRCAWCANPEGYSEHNLIFYSSVDCQHCGRCTQVCPQHIGTDLNLPSARSRCTGCGRCVSVCPVAARQNTATEYTVEQILAVLEKEQLFFRQSGGGVTYSGGECTLQFPFLDDLSREVYDAGIPQTMETCAFFDPDEVRPVLDRMDLIFVDIKHMDSFQHRKFTGVPNERILSTVAVLGAERNNIVIRVPVITGVNGDDENIVRTAQFVRKSMKKPQMELLPYHRLGFEKYVRLGYPCPSETFLTPSDGELDRLKSLVRAEGVEIVSWR